MASSQRSSVLALPFPYILVQKYIDIFSMLGFQASVKNPRTEKCLLADLEGNNMEKFQGSPRKFSFQISKMKKAQTRIIDSTTRERERNICLELSYEEA